MSHDQPGAHERHLQRKQANPLFGEATISAEAWRNARNQDQQERNAFLAELEAVLKQAAGLDAHVDSEIVLDFKERLERLYVHAMSLGGELSKQRQALLKLLDITMQTLQRGAAEDPVALQKLDDELEARAIYFRILQTPLVADLMRGDEVIDADELIPTLLSEDEDNISAALELFEPEQLQALASEAQAFLDATPAATAQARRRLELIVSRAAASHSATH